MNLYNLTKATLLVIILFGLHGLAEKETGKVFEDEDFKFSVQLPVDWIQITPAPAGFRLKLVRKGLENRADIGIVTTHAPGLATVSSTDFVQRFLDDPSITDAILRRASSTAKLISSGKTSLTNRDAYYFKSSATFETPTGKIDTIVYQILLLCDGDSFSITIRAPEKNFEDLFNESKTMMSTFTVRSTVQKTRSAKAKKTTAT